VGIRISAEAGAVTLAENTFSGLSADVQDRRKG
jgi:hypothetical protein